MKTRVTVTGILPLVALFAALALVGVSCTGGYTGTGDSGDPAAPPGGEAVAVTGVTVSPPTVSMAIGDIQTFTATVTGTGSPAQTVTWTVSGGGAGTTITADGILTVADNENAEELTVRATSTVDAAKSGTAVVTISGDITEIQIPERFTVTFDANGGTLRGDATFDARGGTVYELPVAERTGYVFTGWNTERNGNGTDFTTETIVTANITVYALWISVPAGHFAVIFDANGGTLRGDAFTFVARGGTVAELPYVTLDGYVFDGWYTEQYLITTTTPFTAYTPVTANITVYAFWKPAPPYDFPTSGTLTERLAWLSSYAVDGGDYTIELKANETMWVEPKPLDPSLLEYGGKTVKITLKGDTVERTVSLGRIGLLLIVGSGVTLTLDNNITLRGRGDNATSLVWVNLGGTLIMKGNAKITSNMGGHYYGGGVFVRGSFTMSGSASVSGNTTSDGDGGGVAVEGGSFTMSGSATVTGNTASASAYGGGVYVWGSGATFTMSDSATVSGNTASYPGGGVAVEGGSFTMSGNASISGNKVTGDYGGGGGVHVYDDGSFTMSGNATVSGNTASSYGGGVYVTDGSFTMNGSASVSGNTAPIGGGVGGGGSFTMNGSTSVSGNTASSYGGGVYAGGSFIKTGGIIYGSNETNPALRNIVTGATDKGAAVYVMDGAHWRETTVGAGQNLSKTSAGTFTGQWTD